MYMFYGRDQSQMLRGLYFVLRDWLGEMSLDSCILIEGGAILGDAIAVSLP